MPTMTDLLSDPNSHIELIVKGQYLDEADVSHTEWISQTGWDDEISGPAATYILPLLTTSLRIDHQIEPLEPSSSFDTLGNIELSNNHLDYAGRYDLWWRYSVDGQSWTIYAVGVLSDGTRVELSDVVDTPLYDLQGINIPEVGSDTCLIRCKDRHDLSVALQPVTYSPPALYFPGTIAGYIDLGNNLNITSNQSFSVWIYLTDPISTTQYILFKDSGAAGYYLAVGLVGAGTITAGVEILVRGQSPTTSTTAAGVLQPFRWHRIDIAIGGTTRRIDIDGATALTTTGITGTPTTTTTILTIGKSLLGRMSRVLYYSVALSNAAMAAIGRTPITGLETDLREGFLLSEGQGNQIASSKSGSALVGTLGTGILWDNASWHYESLLGRYEPYVIGTVPRVPIAWIDPPKQIGQVSRGPIGLISEVQSNHTAVSSANYSVNLTNATLTVTSGALSGTYSATVTANNLWKSAILLDGATSQGIATLSMPTGSRYLGVHFRADNTNSLARQLAGWNPASGTRLQIILVAGSTNILQVVALNDAGTAFSISTSVSIVQGKRYSVFAGIDTANPSTGLRLYLSGVLIGTAAISGTWANTTTAFNVGRRFVGAFNDNYFKGVIDEIAVGNIAPTLALAESFHAIPSTSAMSGIVNGWHFDEATGTTAAPFVGAVSITLTATTWTAGRSAPVDLARSILYTKGYTESDLDSALWLAALNKNISDCGWYVSGGAKAIDVINVILGGLGFVIYLDAGIVKITRFEGVSGTATDILDGDIDIQSQPIEALAADPAIYLWTINFATNNSKQDQANISGGLASTDPDRYQYGAMVSRSVSKQDGAILERFPNAEPRTRMTALLNLRDAEDEGARLLALHRYGADRKSIAAFLSIGSIDILGELAALTTLEECDLDSANTIVTGVSIEDGIGMLAVWRPAQ